MNLLELSGPLGHALVSMRLRIMMRRLPHAHRAWVHSDHTAHRIRPESNREYLTRLERLANERQRPTRVADYRHSH
jgi:hypothetical protein